MKDISYAKDEKWGSSEYLSYFQERHNFMRSGRAEAELEWEKVDRSYESISFYDNLGELQTIIPIEKVIIEIYEGSTKGTINFNIKNDGQPNENLLQPTKYALQQVLDGDEVNNFWVENKNLKSLKAKYGNGIFFTGIRNIRETTYISKDNGKALLSSDKYEEKIKETTLLFPKSIHIRDFYIDDGALGQPGIQYAEDCIMKERITRSELQLRYKDNDDIDQKELDKVTYGTDYIPKNDKEGREQQDEIIIYHYYNKADKTYLIIANEEQVLYVGKYLYIDGKLPFENIQHYYDPNSFYNEGLATRVRYLKICKGEILQNILTASQMSSGVSLLTGNDDIIGQDWSIGGRQLNLLRSTGGIEQIRELNTKPNNNSDFNLLELIDREITIVTGINPSEQIDPGTDTLGIAELNEANKAVRSGSVDESYEIGLDNALTMTLSRIKQFGLIKEVKKIDGEPVKSIYQDIYINDMKRTERDGEMIFEEEMGKTASFRADPKIIKGSGVKVTTSSTSSILPIVERKRVTDNINNIMTLGNVASLDQTGGLMKQLQESINFEQLIEKTNEVYGFDNNNLKVRTTTDKQNHTIKLMNEALQNIATNDNTNVQQERKTGNQAIEEGSLGAGDTI